MKAVALTPPAPINLARDEIPIEDWREVIRHEAWTYVHSKGGTYKSLARQTGLTPATISRIAQGETKFPRFDTVRVMLRALGYNIFMRKS